MVRFGFCFHGRGYGFALDSSPAVNGGENRFPHARPYSSYLRTYFCALTYLRFARSPAYVYEPGAKPFHTLMPAIVDGVFTRDGMKRQRGLLAVACKGVNRAF